MLGAIKVAREFRSVVTGRIRQRKEGEEEGEGMPARNFLTQQKL